MGLTMDTTPSHHLLLVQSINHTSDTNVTLTPELNLTVTTTVRPDSQLSEVDFDYYDISQRAQIFLAEPVNSIALVASVVAVAANILSLVVMSRVRSLLPSQFILISSLALSDVLVGTSVLLHIVHKVLQPSYYPGHGPWAARLRSMCGYMAIKALNTTAINISLLNLMAMAIDHYVAILRPLLHSTAMSRRRCIVLVIAFWLIAFLCGFSDFLSVLAEVGRYRRYRHKYNLCEFIYVGAYQDEYTLFALALACLFTMLFIYARIYAEVHCKSQHRPPQQDLQRNKKALVTTLLIVGTFVLCVMPNCIFQITLIVTLRLNPAALAQHERALRTADQYLYDLVLLNSLCDPIIYALRIREVRHGYIRLLCGCARRLVFKARLVAASSSGGGVGGVEARKSSVNSTAYQEQSRQSRTLLPQHLTDRMQVKSSRAHILWPWNKETRL